MAEWREVPGYPSYECTADGRLRSYRKYGRDRARSAPIRIVPYKISGTCSSTLGYTMLRGANERKTLSRASVVALAWGKDVARPLRGKRGRPTNASRDSNPATPEKDPELVRLAQAWEETRLQRLGNFDASTEADNDRSVAQAERDLADRLRSHHGGWYVTQTYRQYEIGPSGRVEVYGVRSSPCPPIAPGGSTNGVC